jgi:aminopeptidase N
LAVGDFERVSTKSEGTDVGIVVSRGQTEKAKFALGQAAGLLHYYNRYFQVAYPLPKLDLVAAPGSIGGAMENWGAIFYSQDALLIDPKISTRSDEERVFAIVAHEMSHQWFGDLVTMEWWDNLWLNEGFARWMELKAMRDIHPEWKSDLVALRNSEYGKYTDGKSSTHPVVQPVATAAEADEAFDTITYAKGASVIRMIEAYAGPDAFQRALGRHVSAHAYGNTTDSDLWREVHAMSGKPILPIAEDFTRQAGLPFLRVEASEQHGGELALTVSEARFVQDRSTRGGLPAQAWHIPFVVRAGSDTTTHLLAGKSSTLSIPDKEPVIVNAGQTSYVRVQYPEFMLAQLRSAINTLPAADQYGMLCDLWALGYSGDAPITDYLNMSRSISTNANPVVLRQMVETLLNVDRMYRNVGNHDAFVRFAMSFLQPLGRFLGWEPSKAEDPETELLRQNVLVLLSRLGDQGVIKAARQQFDKALDTTQSLSAETRRTVLRIVAYHATEEEFTRLLSVAKACKDPLQREDFSDWLGEVADPKLADRFLEYATGPDAPAGFAAGAFFVVSLDHPDLAWERMVAYLKRPDTTIDLSAQRFLVPGVAEQSFSPSRIGELQSFASQHFASEAHQGVNEAIATIKMNAVFRAERIPQIDEWLAREQN